MSLSIETHIITWNRSDTIHLTVGYYLKLGRVIVHDNYSDDNTREICESLGAEVKLFGQAGVLNDQAYKDLKNNCWKGSDADWVIIVDDDEILYEEALKYVLAEAKMNKHTIFKTQGIQIHSDSMPKESWLELKNGWKDNNYSKLVIFNPSEIKEINYEFGCHTHCNGGPKGNLSYAPNKLFLLHYNFVGGVDRIIKRWGEYEPRRQLSSINMRWNLGHRYSKTESEIRSEWLESERKSRTLQKVGLP
jgi:glycosyltransferase involved in cell wall biosynthesis